MGSEGEFLQLHLSALAHDVAALEDALLAAGALSVTLGDQQDVPILEPGVGETPLWPEVRVSALFEAHSDRAAILENLEHTLGTAPEAPSWEHLEARAWEREWLQHFAPVLRALRPPAGKTQHAGHQHAAEEQQEQRQQHAAVAAADGVGGGRRCHGERRFRLRRVRMMAATSTASASPNHCTA